jgi:hypothetical protein
MRNLDCAWTTRQKRRLKKRLANSTAIFLPTSIYLRDKSDLCNIYMHLKLFLMKPGKTGSQEAVNPAPEN